MRRISVSIGNTRYEFWKSVSIIRRLDALAGAFDLTLTNPPDGTARAFKPGEQVEITHGDKIILTGHIDAVSRLFDGGDHSIGVAGRSLVADAVDCVNPDAPLEFNNSTLAFIARKILKPFDIEFVAEASVASLAIPYFSRQATDAVGESLLRLSRQLAVWIVSDGNGAIRAFRPQPDATPKARFKEGVDILTLTVSNDHSGRFSDYIVKASESLLGGSSSGARAKDGEITRHRPMLLNAVDGMKPQQQARFESASRAAKGLAVEVTVQGLHGNFQPGDLIHIESKTLEINQPFAIRSVEMVRDEDGSRTILNLSKPDALLRLKEPIEKQGGLL